MANHLENVKKLYACVLCKATYTQATCQLPQTRTFILDTAIAMFRSCN